MTALSPSILSPQSVAIIGASDTEGSVGQSLVHNICSSFPGPTYLINPNQTTINKQKAFAHIGDVPSHIDLAVIAVPAAFVSSIVRECNQAGVSAAIIISAGFSESGVDGKKREEDLKNAINEGFMTVIGPNCLGVIAPHKKLNASFAATDVSSGNVALVTQSGALGTALLDYANEAHLGFSACISLGNKTAVNETDVLEFLEKDPHTTVILLYVEDITDAARFVTVARQVGKTKPIIVLKSGATAEGSRASASHTGALGGNDRYYDALFTQSFCIRVSTIAEFLATASMAAKNPRITGNRTAIITNAGGPGILMTDAAVRAGLHLPTLSASVTQAVKKTLPSFASVGNPIDLLGDATSTRYKAALTALEQEPSIDNILFLLTPQSGTDTHMVAETIVHTTKTKLIGGSFMGGALVQRGIDTLHAADVSVTQYPEDAAKSLGFLYWQHTQQSRSRVPAHAQNDGDIAHKVEAMLADCATDIPLIPEQVSRTILDLYGFPLVRTQVAKTKAEAVSAVTDFHVPCVMKIISPDVIHKRDVGGVLLNVTAENVAQQYDSLLSTVKTNLPKARIFGVSISEMAPIGLECIIGMHRQENFGPLVMVGLGGTAVEVTKDVSFRVAPIDTTDAIDMISSLHAHQLFEGYRGSPPYDTEILTTLLLTLCRISKNHPRITDIDVNPIILYPRGRGARVVDIRMLW